MTLDISKRMHVDDTLEHYNVFSNEGWATELFRIADGKSKLEQLVFDLTLSFKGISLTRALPLLSVDVAEAYSVGHQLDRLSNSLTLKLLEKLTAELSRRVILGAEQRRDLQAAMLEIMEDFYKSTDGQSFPFPRQELWDTFVKVEPDEPKNSPKNEFRLGLWASQRICYSAFFFAYEDFLVRCLSTYFGKQLQTGKEFPERCNQLLGADLAEKCWNCNELQTAKFIRHALVHEGGRETKKLKNRNHRFSVIEGQLQIVPGNISELHILLKERSKLLTEWAALHDKFL